jgi:methionine sulfoxide reductase heme-binding subunit
MIIATSVSPHLFWITSRAAGIVSLVLASLAVSAGLVMSLRMMRARRPDLVVLHEVLSLGTLAALAVHGLALLGDHFLSPTLADIALPFAWSYKTLWTSIGIIGGWALIILGVSYYARHAIGANRWRKLHRFTALAWIAGIVHTLGEGTDAGQMWFLAMLAVVAVPAVVLLAVRYLTEEETPRPTAGPRNQRAREELQPRRVADHEARELPAAPRPAGPALG